MKRQISLRDIRILLIALFSFLILQGCKQPIENPESIDPIYRHLQSFVAKITSQIEAESKAHETALKDYQELQAGDKRRAVLKRELLSRKKKMEALQQERLYYQIRVEQRKAHARKEYLKAFRTNSPWPDPNEYRAYRAMHEIKTSSRNWDDRVPKTNRYSKNPTPASAEPRAPQETD